ncbi:MAG: M28 family peptidase [Calditrichia bacterium]
MKKAAFLPLFCYAILFCMLLGGCDSIPTFNGQRAFADLEKQVAFGPRVPGSEAHKNCGDYLVSELKALAGQVNEQQFNYQDKKDSTKSWPGRNIVASFNIQPKKNFRIILGAHWDCRPFADRDPDEANRTKPVPGANDAASGVAVLLEMARILKDNPPDFGVDIVFFDLEDLGDSGAALKSDTLNPFCIGSEYFVKNNPGYRPAYGVLLDMVGDADLRLPKEGFSVTNAPHVVDQLWSAAERAKASAFVVEVGEPIMDDHYHFLKAGIPMIDIIDFDYPYWHTVDDTPDKCSPESLQQVGNTLVEWIYNGIGKQ